MAAINMSNLEVNEERLSGGGWYCYVWRTDDGENTTPIHVTHDMVSRQEAWQAIHKWLCGHLRVSRDTKIVSKNGTPITTDGLIDYRTGEAAVI